MISALQVCREKKLNYVLKAQKAEGNLRKKTLLMIDLFLKSHRFYANLITIFLRPDSCFFQRWVLAGLRV